MDTLEIAENIKRICKEKGTTPTVACSESGAGKNMVSNMKKKGTQPSIAKMQLLAEYLGVTTGELLGEKETPATVSGDGQADKLAQALHRIGIEVDKLSDAEISRIARLAKAALEE